PCSPCLRGEIFRRQLDTAPQSCLGFAMRHAWTVLASRENEEGNRCVDVFRRHDASFGFEEYRRDPEDRGDWTLVAYHAHRVFATRDEAEAAAAAGIAWMRP